MSRISRDQLHCEILTSVAKRGTCKRLQVGAILIKDKRVINHGYNGPVSGDVECSETSCDLSKGCTRAIHAEQNILANCAKHGIPTEGATMWVSYNPCPTCARLIVQSGIKEVVYLEEYRLNEGKEIMERAGIKVRKYERTSSTRN